MKHSIFRQSAAVMAVLGILTLGSPSTAFGYFGGSFTGGAVVVTPTPTLTPVIDGVGGGLPSDEELVEILGATTQLPATGAGDADRLLMALFVSMFASGAILTKTGVRRLSALR